MAERTLEQWRDLLIPLLIIRRAENAKLRAYYDGNHAMPTAPNRADEKYLRLAELAVTNVCELIVDGTAAKLTPIGVRLTEDGSDADLELWRQVWVGNQLNADCRPVHEEALKVGRSPILGWPTTGPDGKTIVGFRVTIEDADEVIVAYEPGSRRRRAAALKLYSDADVERATVWTASRVHAWTRRPNGEGKAKQWADDPDDATRGENPLKRVPVVEFLCKPDTKGNPKPELSLGVQRLQDRLNKTMFDGVVAGEDGAFPQRVFIGIEVETDDDGNAINPIKYGPNRTLVLKSDDPTNPSAGQVTQLDSFDNQSILRMADATTRQLGLVSRTSSLLIMGGANVGADMIRALDDGHKSKVLAHQEVFGEAWEEMFTLAHIALKGSAPESVEIDWVSPEFRSPTELADAVIKMRQAGYPFAAIARYTGASLAEVKQMIREREAELAEGTSPDRPPAAATPPALQSVS